MKQADCRLLLHGNLRRRTAIYRREFHQHTNRFLAETDRPRDRIEEQPTTQARPFKEHLPTGERPDILIDLSLTT